MALQLAFFVKKNLLSIQSWVCKELKHWQPYHAEFMNEQIPAKFVENIKRNVDLEFFFSTELTRSFCNWI